jgi:DNA-binding NtrC family response regulator
VLRLLHSPVDGIVTDPGLPLSLGRVPMGREVDPNEGVCLHDPRASRLHAVLHVTSRSRRVRIADEDSKNGTFVNGERVDECWLEDGDVIRVADTHFLLRTDIRDEADAPVEGIVGSAPTIQALRRTIAQVGPHEVTVLLLGESGSGKEVAAAAIHQCSARRGAFVAVNCAAIPEQLAESQLFGHVAGAFTDARSDSAGFFRSAEGGTLFLDEIGELPQALQPKLLRALEQRAVTPVGATRTVPCDVRIVAATNRDLEASVGGGAFRGDLFARLAEFTVHVPALRERVEDVLPLLAHAFGSPIPPLSPDLVAALLGHGWPYNVREVFAVARELRVRGSGHDLLEPELVMHRLGRPSLDASGPRAPRSSRVDPDEATDDGVPDRESGEVRLPPPTREELERILSSCRGNIRAISRTTGRSRMQVYRWIEQYGLDLEAYREK